MLAMNKRSHANRRDLPRASAPARVDWRGLFAALQAHGARRSISAHFIRTGLYLLQA